MSWLFSQALVAEYSADTCSGGAPSAPLSVMPTQHKFWRNDKTIEPSRLSLFGLTCAVLTESHGEALLTSFLADSRVRTYPLLEKVSASRESAPDSGSKWRGSFAKYSPDTSSWKTAQGSLLADSVEFSETWPSWGIAINGDAYQLPTLVQGTKGKGFGLWPTPTVFGNNNRKGLTKKSGDGLATAVKKWPTPNASDATGGPGSSGRAGGLNLRTAVNGQLNPTWVEWLMGWPIGWTELKPLEMDKFREWRRQHSPCLVKSEVAA